MLDSLGGEAVGFAPESELNMGRGVLAGLVAGSLVGDTIGRSWLRLGGLAAVGEQGTAEQDCVDHDFLRRDCDLVTRALPCASLAGWSNGSETGWTKLKS